MPEVVVFEPKRYSSNNSKEGYNEFVVKYSEQVEQEANQTKRNGKVKRPRQ
jgi:hypothetical protein